MSGVLAEAREYLYELEMENPTWHPQQEAVICNQLLSRSSRERDKVIEFLKSEPPLDWEYLEKEIKSLRLQRSWKFVELRYKEMFNEPVPKNHRMNPKLKERTEVAAVRISGREMTVPAQEQGIAR